MTLRRNVGTSFTRRYTYKIYPSAGGRIRIGIFWFFSWLKEQLANLFLCPLEKDPIYFTRDDIGPMESKNLYDEATKELIEKVFESRKEMMKRNDPFAFTTSEHEVTSVGSTLETEFPGWTPAKMNRLRDAFEKVGLVQIPYSKFTEILEGVKHPSLEEDRIAHFDEVDDHVKGCIDFEDFCLIVYNLERVPAKSGREELRKVYDTEKFFTRSLQKLNVVEQMQSGLF